MPSGDSSAVRVAAAIEVRRDAFEKVELTWGRLVEARWTDQSRVASATERHRQALADFDRAETRLKAARRRQAEAVTSS